MFYLLKKNIVYALKMPKAAYNLYKTDIPLILPVAYIDTNRQLWS